MLNDMRPLSFTMEIHSPEVIGLTLFFAFTVDGPPLPSFPKSLCPSGRFSGHMRPIFLHPQRLPTTCLRAWAGGKV